MKLFELDTEDANDRSKLREQIRTASLADLKQARVDSDQEMLGILKSRPLTRFESLTLQMLDLQIKISQSKGDLVSQRDRVARVMEETAPEPEPSASSWEELRVFAERLPRQGADLRPHTPLTHLKQRLGNSQLCERPPVRARSSGGATIITVDGTNSGKLLETAAGKPWSLLTPEGLARFKTYAESMELAVAKPCRLEEGSPALWSKVLAFSGESDDQGKPCHDEGYEKEFTHAWQAIIETVEGEVLKAIGLPDVRIYSVPPAEVFGDRPCFYQESTQTMYFRSTAVNARQIQHEFGHHIEEQGPVEIWFGLASILYWLSGDRMLREPEGGAREVVYPLQCQGEARVGVPDYPYGASYYADAGTELLAFSVQWNLLGNIDTYLASWSRVTSDQEVTVLSHSNCGPEFALLLLHALRPGEMRAAGFTYPALL